MAKRAHKSNRTDKRRAVAGGAHEALPALSSLSELPAYTELTASDRQRTAFEQEVERIVNAGEARREELDLGCVVRLDRGFPAVITPRGVYRTEFAASLTKGDDNSRAAVGDWVCARRPEGHDMGILCKILPRESDIARWKGGSRGERQTLAANVDTVLVTQALGPNPISVDRVVRSAVIARDCGADIAVVLTKADRAGASMLQTDVTLIQEVLGQDIRIVATSAGASDEGRWRVSGTRPIGAVRDGARMMSEVSSPRGRWRSSWASRAQASRRC
jgi:ribosome biogenesis GTPase